MDFYYTVILISSILVISGLVVYLVQFFRYREVFDRQRAIKTIFDLISHVPDAKSGPGAHIFAGVFVVGGSAVGLAAVILDVIVPAERNTGTIVSTSGLILGVVFSAIALWTLWQTRRLDFQLGFNISGFHDLITHINNDLEELVHSIQSEYAMRPQPFHRVYLVTTNPFFGRLSHPHSPETTKYLSQLFTLAQFAGDIKRTSEEGANISQLEFKIICGTKDTMSEFHEFFYGTRPGASDLIARANDDAERSIAEMNRCTTEAGADCIFNRRKRIPRVQFMIISNTLYEFALDSTNSQTEIFKTTVSKDSRYCNAFVDNFNLLLNVGDYQTQDNTSPSQPVTKSKTSDSATVRYLKDQVSETEEKSDE